MNKDELRKKTMWEAYWRGYQEAYDVETMLPVAERAAETSFEHWWENNYK